MTLHVGPLPAGDERHLKALDAAAEAWVNGGSLEDILAAYHRSLAEQGVRLVDASEVAEWLYHEAIPDGRHRVKAFLARFGGDDER